MESKLLCVGLALANVMVGTGIILAGDQDRIVIQVIDGRNGKPIANEHIVVFQGAGPDDLHNKNIELQTNSKGIALLEIHGPSISRIQVWVDWHVLCQEDPNSKSFSIEEIRQTGLSTPNACGRAARQNEPDHFVVFARPERLREKMRE